MEQEDWQKGGLNCETSAVSMCFFLKCDMLSKKWGGVMLWKDWNDNEQLTTKFLV